MLRRRGISWSSGRRRRPLRRRQTALNGRKANCGTVCAEAAEFSGGRCPGPVLDLTCSRGSAMPHDPGDDYFRGMRRIARAAVGITCRKRELLTGLQVLVQQGVVPALA
jgi:hypothetical protein